MELIPNAGKWYRMASVVAALLIGLANLLIATRFFGFFDTRLTVEQIAAINTFLVGTVVPLLRMLKQSSVGTYPDTTNPPAAPAQEPSP